MMSQMAAICANLQILVEHLTIEAIVDTSRTDAATRLAALNYNSWRFLEATIGAIDKDYQVFSQCAHAYLNSRASRLVPGASQAARHCDQGTHYVKA
ncbi:hypothetical protein D1007_13521 [Hordeum vulgare]|nr:hypothetical protein D1007_13521 [Hordeum vulgare]